jgi:poly(hydroxyalkanoate) granule-associated protein
MTTTKRTASFEAVRDYAREVRDDARKAARHVWLAGLGAVATAEEQARGVFDDLVTRGERFEKRENTKIGEAFDQTTDRVKTIGRKVEDGVQQSVATVLHRVGIPSHKEISTLIDRVEKLTKKVEGMRA